MCVCRLLCTRVCVCVCVRVRVFLLDCEDGDGGGGCLGPSSSRVRSWSIKQRSSW